MQKGAFGLTPPEILGQVMCTDCDMVVLSYDAWNSIKEVFSSRSKIPLVALACFLHELFLCTVWWMLWAPTVMLKRVNALNAS
jgi:hypothetical protein